MASFQAKTGWETLRKRENKNYRSDQFVPDPLQRIPKKMQKNFKKPLRLLFGPKDVRKARERKKKKLSFRSIPTQPAIENSKKIAKKLKKSKYIVMASFQAKQVRKGREIQEIKIIVPISYYPARYRKFQKKQLKILKN